VTKPKQSEAASLEMTSFTEEIPVEWRQIITFRESTHDFKYLQGWSRNIMFALFRALLENLKWFLVWLSSSSVARTNISLSARWTTASASVLRFDFWSFLPQIVTNVHCINEVSPGKKKFCGLETPPRSCQS